MRRDLTHEHVADMAVHCALAGAFVGLVMGGLVMQAMVEGF